jgi:hypothetical protein
VCALALAAAGCGSDPPDPAPQTRATATTRPNAKVVVKAKAPSTGQLRQANLRTADLPKWRTATASEAPAADEDQALSACAGIGTDTRKSVVRRSPEELFGQPGRTGNFVASKVLLMKDEKTVGIDVKDMGTKRARACLAAGFATDIRRSGTYAEVWAHEPIQLPAGVKGRGIRLKIKLNAGIGPVPIYIDLVMVTNRRVESLLFAFTTGRTMDPDLQKSLITTLHTRAKAIA